MDHKISVSPSKSAQPSKFFATIAVLVAFSLPYFLIKTFRHKHQGNYTKQVLTLPESSNLTKLPPKENQPKAQKKWEVVITREKDSLANVFQRLGLSRQTLQAILRDNPHAKALSGIKPNQKLEFLIHNKILEKLIVPISAKDFLLIERNGKQYTSELKSHKVESHNQYITATIRGSLYGTAKRMNISYKLIQQMTEIFNWEIDFSKDVRAGDQFTILYKALFVENKLVDTGEIIAVTYKTRHKTFQAIRHSIAHDNYDYFTPEGTSLRKAFTRYPVKFSHISSTFSLSRMHPTLHYKRPHKGVDLAAPLGTPIRATGDGRIAIIGRQSGYGNMVKIIHNRKYSTIYGHLLKFQKGLSKGDYVKRGQVIGYVGQSGLATGPHCHYEFHINQQARNPTTVELPRASSVPAHAMALFKANAGTLLAHMKLYEEAHLARAADKKNNKTA